MKYKDDYQREANAYAERYGLDPSTRHNGEWDAFRHAYASAAATQDYGRIIAHIAGNANEIYGDVVRNQPSNERRMDEWNNAVGRRIGDQTDTRDEAARRTKHSLDNGDLIAHTHSDTREYSYLYPPTLSPENNPASGRFDAPTEDASGYWEYDDSGDYDWTEDDEAMGRGPPADTLESAHNPEGVYDDSEGDFPVGNDTISTLEHVRAYNPITGYWEREDDNIEDHPFYDTLEQPNEYPVPEDNYPPSCGWNGGEAISSLTGNMLSAGNDTHAWGYDTPKESWAPNSFQGNWDYAASENDGSYDNFESDWAYDTAGYDWV